MPISAPLRADLSSDSFQDKTLRLKVQAMERKAVQNGDRERVTKRRKVSRESKSMLFIINRLCKVLDIQPKTTNALANVEDILM